MVRQGAGAVPMVHAAGNALGHFGKHRHHELAKHLRRYHGRKIALKLGHPPRRPGPEHRATGLVADHVVKDVVVVEVARRDLPQTGVHPVRAFDQVNEQRLVAAHRRQRVEPFDQVREGHHELARTQAQLLAPQPQAKVPVEIVGVELEAGLVGAVHARLAPDGAGQFNAVAAQPQGQAIRRQVRRHERHGLGKVLRVKPGPGRDVDAVVEVAGGIVGYPALGFGHHGHVLEGLGPRRRQQHGGAADIAVVPPCCQAFAYLVHIRAVQ